MKFKFRKSIIGNSEKFCKTEKSQMPDFKRETGFTVVEVILAASIMIILCVGTLTVYSYVIKVNMGNNLRSQALTVLQAEAEFYRSLKYVPDCNVTDVALNGNTYTRPPRTSEDGTDFNITVTIDNYPFNDGVLGNDECVAGRKVSFKQIHIDAVMANPQPGWLANLNTNLTILRVRSN